MTAPSRAISIVYESCGLTSRSRHCRGACPGILVVPSDPLVNDPCSLNSAGGSSQFFTSVIYVHANAAVAVVSTECSVAHAMSLMFMPYFVAGQSVYMNQPEREGLKRRGHQPSELPQMRRWRIVWLNNAGNSVTLATIAR